MDQSYDILFLAPSRYRLDFNNSYGQQCLSAYLYQESGITSRLYGGHSNDTYQIIRSEVEGGKVSIVGFYAIQDTITIVKHLARYVKSLGCTVLLGGPQARALTAEEIRDNGIDYVMVGEGEISLNQLMNRLIADGKSTRQGDLSGFAGRAVPVDEIKGLRYVDEKGELQDQGQPVCLEDLNMKTFFNPDWNLNQRTRQGNGLFMMTGRGCPFHCAFCHEGTVRSVRLRSVENVLAEIDYYRSIQPDLNLVDFGDDTFTLNTERVLTISEGLRERGLKWICEAHVGRLYKNPEMIEIMARNGLINTQLGIESGNERVLNAYGKHTTPEMIETVVKNLAAAGIMKIEGNFILGGAFETRETMEDSTRLALKLLEAAPLVMELSAVYYAPFPFTPITSNPDQFDMEIQKDPYDYITDSMMCCVNRTKALTQAEIQAGFREHSRRVKEKYHEIAARLTYTQVSEYLKHVPGTTLQEGMWAFTIRNIEHVYTFLKYGFRYQSLFNEDAVPVRTVSDLVHDGDAVVIESYRITGTEKRFLELASGSFTMAELEKKLGVTRNELYTIYHDLREKLLVYMERF